MKPVCTFVKAAWDDDAFAEKTCYNQDKQGQESNPRQDSGDSASIQAKCPFGYNSNIQLIELVKTKTDEEQNNLKQDSRESASLPAKCPCGYDSQTFKLGPLSCLICQALLYECSICVSCSHVYCKVCISQFKDCPLCGADIEKIEDHQDLQQVVDRFIEGHARIKSSPTNDNQKDQRSCKDQKITNILK